MFESDIPSPNASLGLDSITGSTRKSPSTVQPFADAYGLPEGPSFNQSLSGGTALKNNPFTDGASLKKTSRKRDPIVGSSFSAGGTLLIQGGTTSATEINEVNTLLSQSIYNRDQNTSNQTFTNYRYAVGDARALQSANESVGVDRGDSLTNAINVGTVVFRSSAIINGDVGYTSGGIRDKDDYFSFSVGKTGDFNISLTGLSQNAGLALYDSNHNLVNWSDQAGNASELISGNLSTGNYIARVYSYAGQPWNHGATNYSLKIERQADALENYWRNLLVDSSVRNAALNSIKFDSSLSRTDVIGILKSAGDGGSVTSTELTDLRNFYNQAINTTHVAADLKVLAQKVLFSETSNQWYTGSDSIRATLGNLAANSSTTHLNLLIGKHFLGTDRPAIHRNANNNLVGSYTQANGSLFINGASAADIVQGATADCYFLAALGGTANDKNALISDMFRNNGDGTWSVRFYTNGKVDYVTVDRMMATNNNGNYIYANRGQSVAGNNELWVALAEKAYAQVNESGRIGQDGTNFYGNGNDNGIGWGSRGAATTHITNLSTSTESLTNFDIFGLSPFGLDRNELISLVNGNRIVTIGSFNGNATDSDAGETNISTAAQGHAYTITGYSAVTGRFTIRNPWGNRHLSLTFDQLMQLGGTVTYSNS
jgi:hypothetical protein